MSRTVWDGLKVVVVVASLALGGCQSQRAGTEQGSEQCTFCHGDPANFPGDNVLSAAPPLALARDGVTDRSATDLPGVGAHQAHLRAGAISAAVACDTCHLVPNADGLDYSSVLFHMGGTYDTADPTPNRADLTFTGRAVLGSVAASYDYDTHTCQTYCHGATLSGGSNPTPTWNQVGQGEAECDSCHGMPPTKPDHPSSTSCSLCHPTVDADNTIIDPDRHIDGVVDVNITGCNACHGNETNAAPPVDTAGRSDTTLRSVGAHQAHLVNGTYSTPVACDQCHVVPTDLTHIDGTPEVAFGTLAQADGFTGTDWNGTTCAVYCHGQTIAGGGAKTPSWTAQGGLGTCGTSCHTLPPGGDHPNSDRCSLCHETVDADKNIVRKDLHINGTVEAKGGQCNSCHGNATNAAPPVDTQGRSDTSLRSVGAHQAHLVDGSISSPIACAECHVVPTDLTHIDGTPEVAFGTLAQADGFTGTDWNGTTCAVYCHGQTLSGGSHTAPAWTGGDGEAACGSCHGLPPTTGHPPVSAQSCAQCHGMVVNADLTFKDKSLHVDGTVEHAGGSCDACHEAPPPTGTHLKHFGGTLAQVAYGDTKATADYATGATTSYIFGCGNCHPLDPAKHANGVVDVELYDATAPANTMKQLNPASASYTPGGTVQLDSRAFPYTNGTCANVYCHSTHSWTTPSGVPIPTTSATPAAGEFHWDGNYPIVYPQPVDTYVTTTTVYQSVTWGGAALNCSGCHGSPPQTLWPNNVAGAGDSHSFVNGGVETLHNRTTTVMGADSFPCRTCHAQTVTAAAAVIADARFHVNGQKDVAFDTTRNYSVNDATKSLSGATYTPATKICSVSCHNEQRNDTPRWGDPYRGVTVGGQTPPVQRNNPECLRCHDGAFPP